METTSIKIKLYIYIFIYKVSINVSEQTKTLSHRLSRAVMWRSSISSHFARYASIDLNISTNEIRRPWSGGRPPADTLIWYRFPTLIDSTFFFVVVVFKLLHSLEIDPSIVSLFAYSRYLQHDAVWAGEQQNGWFIFATKFATWLRRQGWQRAEILGLKKYVFMWKLQRDEVSESSIDLLTKPASRLATFHFSRLLRIYVPLTELFILLVNRLFGRDKLI